MTSFKKKAFAIEIQTLANAVDQYKNKFGDYPPDGTDTTIFERHCRKLFPKMVPGELAVVAAASNCTVRPAATGASVMDPPEALVFFLGGFSKDPQHPFTGTGGPLSATTTTSDVPYQYNTDRNEPFYEFPESQLSLVVVKDRNGDDVTISNDESKFGLTTPSGFVGDVIPVFHAKNKVTPYVYFDSRTYSVGGTFFNNYALGGEFGYARPYKEGNDSGYITNTKVTVSFPVSGAAGFAAADLYYKYANDKTYQIISAGLDDNYGGQAATAGAPPVMYAYPSGNSIDIRLDKNQQNMTRYKDNNAGAPSPQLDNAANFAESLFADALSN